MDREKVIKDNAIRGLQSAIEISGALVHLRKEHAKAILELLKEQEAVIRCKDCKFWYKDECSHLCAITGELRPSNWFCADGELEDT